MISPFERFTRFFRPAQRGGQPSIAIEGVWVRREGARVIVLVQVDGGWVEVIREGIDGPFSHTVASSGIRRRLPGAPDDPAAI